MTRGNYKFTRNDTHDYIRGERVSWLDEFADKLAGKPESAVDKGRKRSQQSIVDQINSIVSNKPVHATVESKVKDMQDRTGLTEYIKLLANERENTKFAQETDFTKEQKQDPFQNMDPEVKEKFIDNLEYLLDKHNGLVSVPAIQYELTTSFEKDIDDQVINDANMAKYINNMITDYQKKNQMNKDDFDDRLKGKTDNDSEQSVEDSNTDFFSALMPSN